jgi:hypothetical protein
MLAACLTAAAAAQAALGLSRRDWYTDDPWVRSTWFGNDAVTLVVVVPLLLVFSRPGSPRNAAVHTGLIAYCAYNYGFYLFGAALNVFFPLYVLLVLLSAILLARGLARTTPPPAARTSPVTRPVAIWLVFVGTGLASVWLGLWARYVFLGEPVPVRPDVFRLVAALDLTIISPALVTSGILMWRRRSWGDSTATVASVGASAYLLVLSVNAAIAWASGNGAAQSEALLWTTLAAIMTATAATLWHSLREQGGHGSATQINV